MPIELFVKGSAQHDDASRTRQHASPGDFLADAAVSVAAAESEIGPVTEPSLYAVVPTDRPGTPNPTPSERGDFCHTVAVVEVDDHHNGFPLMEVDPASDSRAALALTTTARRRTSSCLVCLLHRHSRAMEGVWEGDRSPESNNGRRAGIVASSSDVASFVDDVAPMMSTHGAIADRGRITHAISVGLCKLDSLWVDRMARGIKERTERAWSAYLDQEEEEEEGRRWRVASDAPTLPAGVLAVLASWLPRERRPATLGFRLQRLRFAAVLLSLFAFAVFVRSRRGGRTGVVFITFAALVVTFFCVTLHRDTVTRLRLVKEACARNLAMRIALDCHRRRLIGWQLLRTNVTRQARELLFASRVPLLNDHGRSLASRREGGGDAPAQSHPKRSDYFERDDFYSALHSAASMARGDDRGISGGDASSRSPSFSATIMASPSLGGLRAALASAGASAVHDITSVTAALGAPLCVHCCPLPKPGGDGGDTSSILTAAVLAARYPSQFSRMFIEALTQRVVVANAVVPEEGRTTTRSNVADERRLATLRSEMRRCADLCAAYQPRRLDPSGRSEEDHASAAAEITKLLSQLPSLWRSVQLAAETAQGTPSAATPAVWKPPLHVDVEDSSSRMFEHAVSRGCSVLSSSVRVVGEGTVGQLKAISSDAGHRAWVAEGRAIATRGGPLVSPPASVSFDDSRMFERSDGRMPPIPHTVKGPSRPRLQDYLVTDATGETPSCARNVAAAAPYEETDADAHILHHVRPDQDRINAHRDQTQPPDAGCNTTVISSLVAAREMTEMARRQHEIRRRRDGPAVVVV